MKPIRSLWTGHSGLWALVCRPLLIGLLLAFAGAEGNLVADEPVNTKPFVRFTPRNFTIDFNELPKETVSVDRKFTVQVGGRPIPKSFVVDLYKGVGEMPKAPRRIFYRLARGPGHRWGSRTWRSPCPPMARWS